MKHVIIGVGAAGITAAKTIRALKPQDEILMISEDKHIASRCMLHKYIDGERTIETLNFVPQDFFEVNRIEWCPGVRVTGVDAQKTAVKCEEEVIHYDKLLIASGADSTVPPIGALRSAKNVFCLRHFSDAENIREATAHAQRIVVIGAGLVGLDVTYALLEMKKSVSVVEVAPRLLALNLDDRAAIAYQNRFEAAGCQFHLGKKLTDTIEDSDGNISQIVLDNGSTTLSCDFLVVATGVRPAVSFLEGSGIICDKAVLVDQYMTTNYPNVYAAGDVAGLSGNWPNAMRQGEVAARNMCGESRIYEDVFALKNTINFFGLVTLSLGKLSPTEGDTVEQREDRKKYQKVIMREGRVVGVILQGDISYSGFWQYLLKKGIRVDAIKKPIWKLSFADFCSLDEEGEYSWAVKETA
jgi:NAD(P)H-nitrite reductase large subunit